MLSTEALTPEKSAFGTCSAVLSTLALTPEKSAFFSVLIHNSRLHDYVARTVPWRLLNGDGADVKPPRGAAEQSGETVPGSAGHWPAVPVGSGLGRLPASGRHYP
ncbi:hypothetical protein SM139_3704 [Stenotrophomonas maltophilia]|nr:hypothetical protein SM139_3704 [Stenotrophomonas maltophilia]